MRLDKKTWACDNCNCLTSKPFNVSGDNYCDNTRCWTGETCLKCDSSGGFINSSEPHEGIKKFKAVSTI